MAPVGPSATSAGRRPRESRPAAFCHPRISTAAPPPHTVPVGRAGGGRCVGHRAQLGIIILPREEIHPDNGELE